MFAPSTAGLAERRRSMIGSAERISNHPHPVNSTKLAPSRPSTAFDDQPHDAPRLMATSSAVRPAPRMAAPT